MSEYIKKRIAEGEHQQQDFKFEISDVKKIARSLSAFSNTSGGRLLVGVKDNGVIAGVRTDEEYFMIESAAALHCLPAVEFQSTSWNVDGKVVLEVFIPVAKQELIKAPDKHGHPKVYLRKHDENILANGIFVMADQLKRQPEELTLVYTQNEKNLLHYLNRRNEVTFREYREKFNLNFYNTREVFVKLLAWDIIKMDYNGKDFVYSLSNELDAML